MYGRDLDHGAGPVRARAGARLVSWMMGDSLVCCALRANAHGVLCFWVRSAVAPQIPESFQLRGELADRGSTCLLASLSPVHMPPSTASWKTELLKVDIVLLGCQSLF